LPLVINFSSLLKNVFLICSICIFLNYFLEKTFFVKTKGSILIVVINNNFFLLENKFALLPVLLEGTETTINVIDELYKKKSI
jgi:hypothetical protein